jgi:hypothetical protein
MAADHRHPQPPQAPQAPDRARRGLKDGQAVPTPPQDRSARNDAATHQPRPFSRHPLEAKRQPASDARDAWTSGHENGPGSWRPVLTLGSVDRDGGFLGERMVGRPVWTMGFEPGLCSVAAPATCPVALRARMRRCRLPTGSPLPVDREEEQVRDIALDVHIDFCEVAIAERGEVRSAGRIATKPEEIELFAQSLDPRDRVALEVTGNAWAITRLIEPHVAEVIVVPRTTPGSEGRGQRPTGSTPAPWPSCWPPANSMGCGCRTAAPR